MSTETGRTHQDTYSEALEQPSSQRALRAEEGTTPRDIGCSAQALRLECTAVGCASAVTFKEDGVPSEPTACRSWLVHEPGLARVSGVRLPGRAVDRVVSASEGAEYRPKVVPHTGAGTMRELRHGSRGTCVVGELR